MVGLFHRVEMKCKQRSISDVGVHLLDRYCLMNHYRKLHLSTAHLLDNNFESFIIKKDRLQRLSGAHQLTQTETIKLRCYPMVSGYPHPGEVSFKSDGCDVMDI